MIGRNVVVKVERMSPVADPTPGVDPKLPDATGRYAAGQTNPFNPASAGYTTRDP